MSPYELAVGLRYTRARKGSGRNTFISFISLISMAGIALGVAALIVVLSVMNGFQQELRNRILAVASHIEIRGMPQLANWPEVAQVAMEVEESVIVSPLKPVIRPATEQDSVMREQNAAKEGDAFHVCQQKIQQHKLDMHLVSAEYSFNGSKLVFYFTADKVMHSATHCRSSQHGFHGFS